MGKKINITNFFNTLTMDNENLNFMYINNFLTICIKKKIIFYKSNIKKLKLLAEDIYLSTNFSKSEKCEILLKINIILVMFKNLSVTNTLKRLLELDISNLSEDGIIEFIDILISIFPSNKSLLMIEKLSEQYLTITNNIARLNDKLYFCNELSENELNRINNKLLKYLLECILNELLNENISLEILEIYLEQLSKMKLKRVSNKNFYLIIKIFNIINLNPKYNLQNLKMCLENISNNFDNDTNIRYKLINGEIELTNTFPDVCISNLDLNFDVLPLSNNTQIITIDDADSLDLDGAFSIQKYGDIYILDVFITDVPTFLMKNRDLCQEVYLRGNSIYIHDYINSKTINIDMLPQFLAYNTLSLNKDDYKNTINFNFIINNQGQILHNSISRKTIKVTTKLTPYIANTILETRDYLGPIQDDLRNFQDLCRIISQNSQKLYLKMLKYNSISDLVAFPSILVNYYLGQQAEFAIYRNKGIYTKDKSDFYTHSVTPLRRFVSNINLAFFLEQNGIANFPAKDLNYVETHVDEIINHLNERNKFAGIISKNSNLTRKYVK